MPFDISSLKIKGDPVHLAFNSSNDAMEASCQFEWTVEGKQWYYLFFSSGRCCNAPSHLPPAGGEYKVMVCRSESPTGPFIDDTGKPCTKNGGTMVLGSERDVYGPGGQGVLYDEQLKSPIMYYHYMNTSTGYEVEDVYFGWNKLSFKSGWPVLIGEGDEGYNESVKPAAKASGSPRMEAASVLTLSALFASVALLCSDLEMLMRGA